MNTPHTNHTKFYWQLLASTLITILTLFLLLTAQDASARTIVVDDDDDDGEGDYTTIKDAVDAAEDGDTIRVWEGNYRYFGETTIVNKTLGIIGNGTEKAS